MISRIALLAICLLLLVFGTNAHALPPEIRWSKIETPHFTIIFDSRHKMLGELYARSAEQAFQSVSPVFGLWPEKTVMMVDDSTDIANGSATGVPFPLIMSLPVLPTSLDSVADYGNWGLELVTHEYTHILNFEPATGFMKPLRYVFGSIVRPNILLPRWYSEGLAVEMETRLSSFGRLRSANYLSIIRAMVEDDTLRREDISRINETTIPNWPGGVRPYLMGALLLDELTRAKGDKIIGDLNTAFSHRMPFFINGPIEERLGVGWTKILDRVYDRAEDMTTKQIKVIQSVGQAEEAEVEQRGYFTHSPVVSPDGKHLAFIGKDHNIDSFVQINERGADGKFVYSEKAPLVTTGTVINRASWAPDSVMMVHDGVETHDRYYEYSDLYLLDTMGKQDKQMTHGLRAREPVVSPDGKAIVFVQATPGSTRLAATRFDGKDLTILNEPPIQTRISRPEFLNKTEIIYTEKRDDGAEVFKIQKVKTDATGLLVADGSPRMVLADFKPVHYPRMTSEGLIFVSDRSGVANLYLADKSLTNARAITNTTTRILTAEIDPKTSELIYSKLISYGPQLHTVEKASWAKTPTKLPQVGPFVDQEWPEYKLPKYDADLKIEKYSPWWYLLPRYWMPYAYVAPGVSYFSASTSAEDPTGRHAYSLQLAYDTLANGTSIYGTYINRTTRMPITLSGYNSYDYIYGGSQQRQITDFSLLGSSYIAKLSNNHRTYFGWDYSSTKIGNSTFTRNGPEVGYNYTNIKQRGFEISPEKGGAFQIDYKRYLPGSADFEYDVTDVKASTFITGKLLPERHVLALFGNAVIAPRLNDARLGVSSLSGNYQTLPGVRGVVMRGYNPGVFIGRNLYSGSIEYRFPVAYSYRGYRTLPFFFQRWHGGVFVDGITLDGLAYDYSSGRYNAEKIGRFYYGTGAELRLDGTLFYHLPFQLTVGAYYGLDPRTNPNGLMVPVVSFGL